MNSLRITGWAGRLNNNLIQLLHCIEIARREQYNVIRFPNHQRISGNEIVVSEDRHPPLPEWKDIFFDYFVKQKIKLSFKQRKKDFAQYIKPLLKLDINRDLREEVVVYIRGGDIVLQKKKNVTQPPLYFYKRMLEQYQNPKRPVRLICQDMKNPCAQWLVENKWVVWEKQSLDVDISYLVNARVTCLSHGTFMFLPLMLTETIEELWASDYVVNSLSKRFTDYRELVEGIVRPVYLGEDFVNIPRNYPQDWQRVMLEFEPAVASGEG